MTAATDLSRLILGTAPDSWGVWFPEDAHQLGPVRRWPYVRSHHTEGASS